MKKEDFNLNTAKSLIKSWFFTDYSISYLKFIFNSLKKDFSITGIEIYQIVNKVIFHLIQIASIIYIFLKGKKLIIILFDLNTGTLFNDVIGLCLCILTSLIILNISSLLYECFLTADKHFDTCENFLNNSFEIKNASDLYSVTSIIKNHPSNIDYISNILMLILSVSFGYIVGKLDLLSTIKVIVCLAFVVFNLYFLILTIKSLFGRYQRLLLKECNKRFASFYLKN